MRQLFIILALLMNLCAYSQDDKTVTLVVSGQGKTQDEARLNALRSAIEQAFGAFISAKTEILNDDLVKDEIVSVANGNIKKYDVINEALLPNNLHLSTLNATVSIGKLKSFCQNKGVVIEFGGEVFAYNLRLKKLNQEKESAALNNLRIGLRQISVLAFNYQINVDEPISINGDANGLWIIKSNIDINPNQNFKMFFDILYKTLKAISIPNNEIENYRDQNISIYPLVLTNNESRVYRDRDGNIHTNEDAQFEEITQGRAKYMNKEERDFLLQRYQPLLKKIPDEEILYFRNKKTLAYLLDILFDLQLAVYNFKIDNGISLISGTEIKSNLDCLNRKEVILNPQGHAESVKCPLLIGFSNDEDRIKVRDDTDILKFLGAEWPFKQTRYRFLTDLDRGRFVEFVDSFLKTIEFGTALYLKGLAEIKNFSIQIKEKRSEDEIEKIRQYKIFPANN